MVVSLESILKRSKGLEEEEEEEGVVQGDGSLSAPYPSLPRIETWASGMDN